MKKLFLLIVFLFQFCSYENPFTARIIGDYTNIDTIGNYWLYRSNNDLKKYVEVKKDTTLDGKNATILEVNYQKTYWHTGSGYISRYRDIEINFNGQLFQVENRWQNYIEIPIVNGNSWTDYWQDTLSFFNEPLYRTDKLSATVEGFETVKTEAGSFKNSYRIHFQIYEQVNSQITGDLIIEKTYYEWYAPDVGLVKSTEDGDDWELIDYGNKGEGD